MSFYSGFGGRVLLYNTSSVAQIALPAGHWSLSIKADPIDCTTFEHQGIQDVITNVLEYDLTVDCYHDSNINEVAIPQGIDAGTPVGGAPGRANLSPGGLHTSTNPDSQYISVELDFNVAAATRRFFLTRVLVTSFMKDVDVRGIVKYTFSGKGARSVSFGGASPTPSSVTGLYPSTP